MILGFLDEINISANTATGIIFIVIYLIKKGIKYTAIHFINCFLSFVSGYGSMAGLNAILSSGFNENDEIIIALGGLVLFGISIYPFLKIMKK